VGLKKEEISDLKQRNAAKIGEPQTKRRNDKGFQGGGQWGSDDLEDIHKGRKRKMEGRRVEKVVTGSLPW